GTTGNSGIWSISKGSTFGKSFRIIGRKVVALSLHVFYPKGSHYLLCRLTIEEACTSSPWVTSKLTVGVWPWAAVPRREESLLCAPTIGPVPTPSTLKNISSVQNRMPSLQEKTHS
ncbi:unnamed protein product, partial [Gulo gulo]